MFTRKEETSSYSKKYTIACLFAACSCVALGYYGQSDPVESLENIQSNYDQVTELRRTHGSSSNGSSSQQTISPTPKTPMMTKVMAQAVTDLVFSKKVMNDLHDLGSKLNNDEDVSFLKEAEPALENAMKALKTNIIWGEASTTQLVDPQKIKSTFNDSGELYAELSRMFPKSYEVLTALRQDQKIHQFDLSNTLQDVELLSSSTKMNLRRSDRKLKLRQKFLDQEKLNEKNDKKIWKYIFKSFAADISNQTDKTEAVALTLQKLSFDSSITKEQLNEELDSIKDVLEKRIQNAMGDIKELNKDISNSQCKWWDAMLTLGITCYTNKVAKNKLEGVRSSFKKELRVAQILFDKVNYLDEFTPAAKQLEEEVPIIKPKPTDPTTDDETTDPVAVPDDEEPTNPTPTDEPVDDGEDNMPDWMKDIDLDFDHLDDPSALLQLESYTDGWGDIDGVNYYAEKLEKQIAILGGVCDKVSKDMKSRKRDLDNALIFGN